MRNAEDMEELDAHYRDEEPPDHPERCPECGDDDRHWPDCSRNYRNIPEPRREDHYWLGYLNGRALADWFPLENAEPRLKLELRLLGTTNRPRRAFALGELRGYRDAISFEGHRVAPDDRWGIQR